MKCSEGLTKLTKFRALIRRDVSRVKLITW